MKYRNIKISKSFRYYRKYRKYRKLSIFFDIIEIHIFDISILFRQYRNSDEFRYFDILHQLSNIFDISIFYIEVSMFCLRDFDISILSENVRCSIFLICSILSKNPCPQSLSQQMEPYGPISPFDYFFHGPETINQMAAIYPVRGPCCYPLGWGPFVYP